MINAKRKKREEMISSPPLMQNTSYRQSWRGIFAFNWQNFTSSGGSLPPERLPKGDDYHGASTLDRYLVPIQGHGVNIN